MSNDLHSIELTIIAPMYNEEENVESTFSMISKTMESFDLKRLPVKVTQQVKTLRNGEFIDNNENLLIF